MRNACPGILLILIIVVAAALSGCASGPASPTVVTDVPKTASPTPAPAAMRSGSLFDANRLQWFEYRLTMTGSDKPAVSDVRFDYTTTDINGISVRDDRLTLKITGPDMTVVMDKYYDLKSNTQVGSYVKTVSGSASLSDLGMQASDLYHDNNVAEAYTTGNWPMKSLGTNAVTVDGKTYQCTRYSVGDAGEHGTVWVSGEAPVPVKIEQKSADGDTSTWELIGRG